MATRTHHINGKKIEVLDDLFSSAEKFKLYEFANNSLYVVDRFGATAPEHTKYHKTLKSSFILIDMLNFGFFKNKHILEYIKKHDLRVRECYINLCTASDIYTYHTDTFTDGIMTGLYYMNLEWDPTWEGETHFSDDDMKDTLFSSAFIPGRVVFFDGSIPHKSSQPGPLAEFYRFVFTVKFSNKQDLEKNYNNSVKIDDFIYSTDHVLSDKEKSAIEFIEENTHNIPHSNTTLDKHLIGTFNVLKSLNQDEDVCLAGLFHSLYGTEFFNAGLRIPEEEVVKLIGSNANKLVQLFSHPNRDQAIIDNVFQLSNEDHLKMLYILYANVIEQAYRIRFERDFISTIRNKIDLIESFIARPQR
jgi:hypothetical protein